MANNQVQLKDKNSNKCYPNPYWPVGSIFLSMNNTNPSIYFGGTWQLIGQGRTLVGVDTGQTEFNSVKKTGGSKYLQRHTHIQNPHTHSLWATWLNSGGSWTGTVYGDPLAMSGNHSGGNINNYGVTSGNELRWGIQTVTATNQNTGEGDSQNLQPFITCYVWIRTA